MTNVLVIFDLFLSSDKLYLRYLTRYSYNQCNAMQFNVSSEVNCKYLKENLYKFHLLSLMGSEVNQLSAAMLGQSPKFLKYALSATQCDRPSYLLDIILLHLKYTHPTVQAYCLLSRPTVLLSRPTVYYPGILSYYPGLLSYCPTVQAYQPTVLLSRLLLSTGQAATVLLSIPTVLMSYCPGCSTRVCSSPSGSSRGRSTMQDSPSLPVF